jgi:hypothetical protein
VDRVRVRAKGSGFAPLRSVPVFDTLVASQARQGFIAILPPGLDRSEARPQATPLPSENQHVGRPHPKQEAGTWPESEGGREGDRGRGDDAEELGDEPHRTPHPIPAGHHWVPRLYTLRAARELRRLAGASPTLSGDVPEAVCRSAGCRPEYGPGMGDGEAWANNRVSVESRSSWGRFGATGALLAARTLKSKILWAERPVRVRSPPRAPFFSTSWGNRRNIRGLGYFDTELVLEWILREWGSRKLPDGFFGDVIAGSFLRRSPENFAVLVEQMDGGFRTVNRRAVAYPFSLGRSDHGAVSARLVPNTQ